MKAYMQAMARLLDGADARDFGAAALQYIDPEFARVYRNNSVSAFIDVLKANYKTVYALVGPEYFSVLALAYLKDHPAHIRTLVGYGQGFAGTVKEHLQTHNLPYLASFAKLDRAWTRAHIAADAKPLSMDVLQAVATNGGDLESYTLGLKPDVNLLNNHWPVFALWSNMRDGIALNSAVDLHVKPEHVLVWRRGLEVRCRILTPGEFTFLSALEAGDTLGLATVKCLGVAPDTDMGALLAGMMAAEIFVDENGGADA